MNVTALVAAMPFPTNHFHEGQRVWLTSLARGAAEVVGEFRGHGPFVRVWINWGHHGRPEPEFKPEEVDAMFAGRHGLITKEGLL